MPSKKPTASKAAPKADAGRTPREITDELTQLEADALTTCTPLPSDRRVALHLEFMQAVSAALGG